MFKTKWIMIILLLDFQKRILKKNGMGIMIILDIK